MAVLYICSIFDRKHTNDNLPSSIKFKAFVGLKFAEYWKPSQIDNFSLPIFCKKNGPPSASFCFILFFSLENLAQILL